MEVAMAILPVPTRVREATVKKALFYNLTELVRRSCLEVSKQVLERLPHELRDIIYGCICVKDDFDMYSLCRLKTSPLLEQLDLPFLSFECPLRRSVMGDESGAYSGKHISAFSLIADFTGEELAREMIEHWYQTTITHFNSLNGGW
jgi:hypothetical protein